MLIILIICFATYGWLSCDGGRKTSLSEYKTKGGSGKLSGKFKDEGETMAGLGAMAWIFMLISGVLAFLIMQQLCGAGGNLRKYYLMGGLASVGPAGYSLLLAGGASLIPRVALIQVVILVPHLPSR